MQDNNLPNDLYQQQPQYQFQQQPQQPYPQPQPQIGSNPNKKKQIKVVIIVVVFVVLLALGVLFFIVFNNGSREEEQTNQENVAEEENEQEGSKDFEDLTKEEAIAFLKTGDEYREILPDGYVGDEITDAVVMDESTVMNDIGLMYSYGSLEELEQMVRDEHEGWRWGGWYTCEDDDYQIKEFDYYAIVTPNNAIDATSCDPILHYDRNSLLSFKREYLDYHREEKKSDNGKDINDVAYMVTSDPEVVNYLLRVFSFFSMVGWSGGYGDIYSYDFEEQDDKFVLTDNNVGVGFDMSIIDSYDSRYGDAADYMVINLYRRRFVADKSNGLIHVVHVEDGGTMDVIKSMPITREELGSLPKYRHLIDN